jgi:uncharacterized membrane protein YhaH (DUF805 family)
MSWYLGCWKKYATFSGRARRKEYWMFVLFNVIATVVLSIIGSLILKENGTILTGIYGLAILIPSLAVTVRRLHDTGRKGWWIFISFVPVIGGIWLFVLTLLDSTADNEYGPNPKA